MPWLPASCLHPARGACSCFIAHRACPSRGESRQRPLNSKRRRGSSNVWHSAHDMREVASGMASGRPQVANGCTLARCRAREGWACGGHEGARRAWSSAISAGDWPRKALMNPRVGAQCGNNDSSDDSGVSSFLRFRCVALSAQIRSRTVCFIGRAPCIFREFVKPCRNQWLLRRSSRRL